MATNNDPWSLITKVLSQLALCRFSSVMCMVDGKIPFTSGSEFAHKMSAKDIGGKKKASMMVENVLRTVSLDHKNSGYLNLCLIIENMVDGRVGTLDQAEWLDMCAELISISLDSSSWEREIFPLSSVVHSIIAMRQPFVQLKQGNGLDQLKVQIAVTLCKCCLFLAVVSRVGSGAASALILGSKVNRSHLARLEEELHSHLRSLARMGVFNSLSFMWSSSSIIPFNLPSAPNPFFVGRTDSLEEIAKALHPAAGEGNKAPASEPTLPTVCICGPAGVGKSQLVLEYVYRQLGVYDGVLWVDSSNAHIRDSFVDLATVLKLQVDPEISVPEQVAAVREALESDKQCYAVIFDGVESAAVVEYLPKVGGSHVLVTSAVSNLGLACTAVTLSPLGLEDSILVLTAPLLGPPTPSGYETRYQASGKQDRVAECVEALHHLPLALSAAAFSLSLTQPVQSVAGKGETEFQEAVRVRVAALLAVVHQPDKWGPHSDWDESFDKPSSISLLLDHLLSILEGQARMPSSLAVRAPPPATPRTLSLCASVLRVAACFGSQAVPLPLLCSALHHYELSLGHSNSKSSLNSEVKAAVTVLLSSQLATQLRLTHCLLVHPLLARYLRSRDRKKLAGSAVLAALAATRACQITLPHLKHCWSNRQEALSGSSEQAAHVTSVGLQLARFLSAHSEKEAGLEIWQELLERRRHPVPTSVRALCHASRCLVLGEGLGEWAKAMEEARLGWKELPRSQRPAVTGFALQVCLRQGGSRLHGEVESGGKEAEGVASVEALCDLGKSLVSRVKDWGDQGEEDEVLAAVHEEGALLVNSLMALLRLLSIPVATGSPPPAVEDTVHRAQEQLSLARYCVRAAERALPAADPLLIAALHALGSLHCQIHARATEQLLLLSSFQEDSPWPRSRSRSRARPTLAELSAAQMAALQVPMPMRKKACTVFEAILAQAASQSVEAEAGGALSLDRGVPPLVEAWAMGSLSLLMEGPLKPEMQQKARYLLEAAVEAAGAPRSYSSTLLLSSCQAQLGQLLLSLEVEGSGVEEGMKLLESSVSLLQQDASQPGLDAARLHKEQHAAAVACERLTLLACLLLKADRLPEAQRFLEQAQAAAAGEGGALGRLQGSRVMALLAAVEWAKGGDTDLVLTRLKEAARGLGSAVTPSLPEEGQEAMRAFHLQVADLWTCIGNLLLVNARRLEAAGGDLVARHAELDVCVEALKRAQSIREAVLGVDQEVLAWGVVNLLHAQTARGRAEEANRLRFHVWKLLENAQNESLIRLRQSISVKPE